MKPTINYDDLRFRIEGFGRVYQDLNLGKIKLPLVLLNSSGLYVFDEFDDQNKIIDILSALSKQYQIAYTQMHFISVYDTHFNYYDVQYMKVWIIDSIEEFLYERIAFDYKTINETQLNQICLKLETDIKGNNQTTYSIDYSFCLPLFLLTILWLLIFI